jgi:hypothetical protein
MRTRRKQTLEDKKLQCLTAVANALVTKLCRNSLHLCECLKLCKNIIINLRESLLRISHCDGVSGFEVRQVDEYPGVEFLELKVHLPVLE